MILITGAEGQLGYDVIKELNRRDIPCIGIDIKELNITKYDDVLKFITDLKPTAVIHCAAYTQVDRAEEDIELCTKVNVDGTKNIALACKKADAKMLYISTDYVFPGVGTEFYEVDDKTGPLGAYGQTKLDGELAVKEILDRYFVVRISWAFGLNGNNFVKTMLRLGKEKDSLNVVGDQVGSPTYTADLAVLLCDMIMTETFGTYHATNEGVCSWGEFATEIMSKANIDCKINTVTSDEYKTIAKRPLNSRLSKSSLDDAGFNRLPSWQTALDSYLKELELYI